MGWVGLGRPAAFTAAGCPFCSCAFGGVCWLLALACLLVSVVAVVGWRVLVFVHVGYCLRCLACFFGLSFVLLSLLLVGAVVGPSVWVATVPGSSPCHLSASFFLPGFCCHPFPLLCGLCASICGAWRLAVLLRPGSCFRRGGVFLPFLCSSGRLLASALAVVL